MVGVGSNSQFRSLCERMSLPHLPNNEKFSTNPARLENRTELIEILSKRLVPFALAADKFTLKSGTFHIKEYFV